MNVSRYNAKDCTILVDGVYITGLGEDMVSWAKEEAYFETSVGAQGDVVKSEINNTLHTMSITVQSSSPQLPFLLSLRNRKEPFPAWCINKSMGLRMGGTMANIAEMPEIALGSAAEDIEISLIVFDGDTLPA